MTRDEKLSIYNLVKTAACNYYGYTAKQFASPAPDFFDDAEITDEPTTPLEIATSETSCARSDTTTTENSAPSAIANTKAKSLPAIAAEIADCAACSLCQTRTNTVPGMGVVSPVAMIVGEAPGHDEDVCGLPFVGAAGKLLDKMLAAIQLERNANCYIANVVKCRPPNNRTPTPEEASSCGGFLHAQIDVLKPKIILAAGRTAAQYLLQTDKSLSALRGVFYSYQNIPLLVTYHPSALLRDESNKRPAWEDLKMFRAKLLEIAPDYANFFGRG